MKWPIKIWLLHKILSYCNYKWDKLKTHSVLHALSAEHDTISLRVMGLNLKHLFKTCQFLLSETLDTYTIFLKNYHKYFFTFYSLIFYSYPSYHKTHPLNWLPCPPCPHPHHHSSHSRTSYFQSEGLGFEPECLFK